MMNADVLDNVATENWRGTIQPGMRVEVTGLYDLESELHSSAYSHLIGKRGTVVKSDGYMFEVLIDGSNPSDRSFFFEDELGLLTDEGGNDITMYTPITYKYILGRNDLSAFEKLAFITMSEYSHLTLEGIAERLGVQKEFATAILAKLMSQGLVTEGKGEYKTGRLYFPVFHLRRPVTGDKETEKKDKETVVHTVEGDNDLLLMVAALEKYYKSRGVSHKVSKNGRKKLAKTVEYLNKVWKEKDQHEEFEEFELKSDLYYCYIDYAFKNLIDNELNHLKRLNFAGTKAGWRGYMKKGMKGFDPYLLNAKDYNFGKYMGVAKDTIPKDPNDSGYATTVGTFLLPKLKTKNYPVCKEVLYALECLIVYKMFRLQDVSMLKTVHANYLAEYKRAEDLGKLDSLLDYVGKNRKNSDYCHDCHKKISCIQAKSAAIVNKCSEKVVG